MNKIDERIIEWIELIQMEKLNIVTEDIQVNKVKNKNPTINKQIFKLLLYLCRTADKCDKQKHTVGREIYELTCTLCSILNDIPDANKFVCSLFHIIRCLLAMDLFDEAYEVCLHLKSVTFSSDENVNKVLVKIVYLWYDAINIESSILKNNPSDDSHYLRMKNIIKYGLEIIKIVHNNPTQHLLKNIALYLNKVASICREQNTYFSDFSAYIAEYLDRTKIVLSDDTKYTIIRDMCRIIGTILYESIDRKCFMLQTKTSNALSYYFKEILSDDEECYQCFMLFESMCLNLFSLKFHDVDEIQKLIDGYVKLAKMYGYSGCVKSITYNIVEISESLFTYWETRIRTKRAMCVNSFLLEIMKLVKHVSACLIKQTSNICEFCRDDECLVRNDMYNAVILKTKCANLINTRSIGDISEDVYMLARKFLTQCIAFINEMRNCKCKRWMHLWTMTGALIYNLGIMSQSFYKQSVSLFSLLLTSIIQFEGVVSKSRYISLQKPIYNILLRISSLHYDHHMYREAMTGAALSGLLSYDDTNLSAFHMWANIKNKCQTNKAIMEMTMLACLKQDKSKINELGMSVELSKYNLVELCLKEAKGLQEAKVNLSVAIHRVLNEMKALKATAVQYARVVQMLVYHLVCFNHDEDTSESLKEAVSNLKQVKADNFVQCLHANLEFYMFVNQLHATNKKVEAEMESTNFALRAPAQSEAGENESRNVVPAYTMINIKQDHKLMSYLQTPIKKWSMCFQCDLKEIVNGHESMIIMHTLIIAAEYARLYRYQECEVCIWKLVYTLASEMQNNSAILYVTGRCISLRYIDYAWIATAKELATKLQDTNDDDTVYAIAVFWISLSDFYFECDKYDEARKLLDASRKLPGISFMDNTSVYLYGLDRILYNCHLYNESIKHDEYTRYIVETLYALVSLDEELSARKWTPQVKYLFTCDIVLSATVNLSLRMNSLLAFREIGAHLVQRLKIAQVLGSTIRVAEVLKSLCYIDLSRVQLNDCEVKLQGLEHILNIEGVKTSMETGRTRNISPNILATPVRFVDPIRDNPQNDASPILRNKVFEVPQFMYHKDCDCGVCQNESYHYLILTATHIRAQLYALQRNAAASLQHFHGAFKIKEKLVKSNKLKSNRVSWQERFYSTDYVLLLINFFYSLRHYRNTGQEKITSIVLLMIQMCDTYKLKGHPIYMAVQEIILQHRFQKIFGCSDYLEFTVPDASNIDVTKYAQVPNIEETICVTPTVSRTNTRTKKAISIRRNRTPPLLSLTKISMNYDDEDNTVSPPARITRSRSRLTRRKLLAEEYNDTPSQVRQSKSIEELDAAASRGNESKSRNSKQSTWSDRKMKQMISLFDDFAIDTKNKLDVENDAIDEIKGEDSYSLNANSLPCQKKQDVINKGHVEKLENNNLENSSENKRTRIPRKSKR
ncbi:uncharacterized protein LOC108624081 [Ceratina calcarata]|uniref:Uncharacterized protein LOC108624081 n=1 Tax=Ceratina calcarata TaxID=156304 RepID=A0AAJ7IXL7_9HYME|nr:uncharacterized protein LOC108624081 [Ceratina calcarata]